MTTRKIQLSYRSFTTSMILFAGALCATAQSPSSLSSSADAPGMSPSLPDAPSFRETSDNGSIEAKGDTPGVGFFPTFKSYDASVILPQQTVEEKIRVGLGSSFGPSGLLFSGAKAGINQATNAYPAFRQGATGYSRYYWHAFADQAIENIAVQSLLPIALKQDSRYYVLGHGGLPKRTVYAFSRALITRTDAGHETFNASEILGAGAAAGISTAYYPAQYRTWNKTGQRWLSNVLVDGGFMVVREFWPDMTRKLFRRR